MLACASRVWCAEWRLRGFPRPGPARARAAPRRHGPFRHRPAAPSRCQRGPFALHGGECAAHTVVYSSWALAIVIPRFLLEGRIDALCREIGGRGRADASVAAAPQVDTSELHSELRLLKMTQLRKRAKAAGAGQDALDEADDSGAPKEAMVVLIVALEAGTSEGDGLRAELGELKVSQLKRRNTSLRHD